MLPRVGVAASILLFSTSATAQPSDASRTAAGQALYDEGTLALEASDYPRACPKFEEAARLVPEGVGVKLTLADCYERWGKLASAWTSYKTAEAQSARTDQEDRRAKAEAKMKALEPRLAKVTIDVAPAVRELAGLSISRDGVPVGESLWGVAVPVDSGRIKIVATADGRSIERAVEIVDGRAEVVTIADLGAAPPAQAGSTTAATDVSVPPAESGSSGLSGGTVAGITVGSIGLALTAVGVGFGVVAMQEAGSADETCPEDACASQDALDQDAKAHDFSIVGWVGIGVGIAATTAGIVMIALPSAEPSQTTALRFGWGTVSVAGTF